MELYCINYYINYVLVYLLVFDIIEYRDITIPLCILCPYRVMYLILNVNLMEAALRIC